MTKDETIKQLLQQIESLTSTVDSLNATVDAQTELISRLNQTIQELKEQLNKNSKTVPNRLQVMASKSLPPRACVSRPAKRPAARTDIRGHIWQLWQPRMK